MNPDIQPPIIFKNKSEVSPDVQIIEYYNEALAELFYIRHPQYKKSMPETEPELNKFLETISVPDCYIYYPWRQAVVHTVDEAHYYELRTARNKNIITQEEQKKYSKITVGIIGLSIGAAPLHNLVATSGPRQIKIADYDTVEISNLNRLPATLLDLGANKALVAARRVWELDPYVKLQALPEKISESNLNEFIAGTPKIGILIDAMDTLDIKIMSRLKCREQKIPVIMATSNANSVILDVERFDLEPGRPLFHGRIGDMGMADAKDLSRTTDFQRWIKLATKIVDPMVQMPRMHDSLQAIGKSISDVPQLGTTINLAGVAVAFIVRQIANQEKMPSGRYLVSLEEKLIPNFNSAKNINLRKKKAQEILNHLGINDQN